MRLQSNATAAFLALSLGGLLPLGCGGGNATTDGGTTIAMPDLAPRPPDLAPPPPPPYPTVGIGTQIGDIVYDIEIEGYQLTPQQSDSSMLPYGSIKLDQYFQNPMCKCILLSVSAEWCTPCQIEQTSLPDYVRSHPSLCVMNVLVEGKQETNPPTYATMKDVSDWTQAFSQDYPVGLPGANMRRHLPETNPPALPTNVVIDPKTMTILDVNSGVNSSDPNSDFDMVMQTCGAM